MKVICAPDKFKGSLTAVEAAAAMARGVRQAFPQAAIDLCPLADGGEGTVAAMVSATGGQWRETRVAGPRGQAVMAAWGLCKTVNTKGTGSGAEQASSLTAVIEMAAASGLALLPPEQHDPTLTSTLGTGQLIASALDAGAKRIILGIGGSATTDGGCAAAQALGVRFFDHDNQLIAPPITGAMLKSIARIDLSQRDPRLATTPIRVACDVTNPLTGPQGAAQIYGPQKGAGPDQVTQLDAGLTHLAHCVRNCLNRDFADQPGAGAAGGLGFGLMAFCEAQLRPGIDMVLEAVGFAARVTAAACVLTGEGRLDAQTASGKTVLGVARAATKQGVPTLALAGAVTPQARRALASELVAMIEIGEGLPVAESMTRAGELLEAATTAAMTRFEGGAYWPAEPRDAGPRSK